MVLKYTQHNSKDATAVATVNTGIRKRGTNIVALSNTLGPTTSSVLPGCIDNGSAAAPLLVLLALLLLLFDDVVILLFLSSTVLSTAACTTTAMSSALPTRCSSGDSSAGTGVSSSPIYGVIAQHRIQQTEPFTTS
eukprot:6431-Heterococcus_DN1.PRE.3